MSKKFLAFGALLVVLVAATVMFRSSISGSSAVMVAAKGGWLLPIVSLAALVDSFNPCAFSVLLLTIAFLFSVGKVRSGIIKIGMAYVIGIYLVYILIGLGILQVLQLFNTPHVMARIGAIALLAWGGISLLNDLFPSFPIKLKIPTVAHRRMAVLMEKASLPTAFGLGILVGLFEFPCTGGPYLLVLGLLHDQSTFWRGFAYLVWYNILFVLPLLLILFLGSDKALFDKVQDYRKKNFRQMEIISNLVLMLLGLVILFYS